MPSRSLQRTPSAIAAERLRQLRTERGVSGGYIGREMAALGFPWDRSTVARIETNRREFSDVGEILAVAYILDVSPLVLLLPQTREFPLAPNRQFDGAEVCRWLIGRARRPGDQASDALPRAERQARAWSAVVDHVPWLESEEFEQARAETSQEVIELRFVVDRLVQLLLAATPDDQLAQQAQTIQLLTRQELDEHTTERLKRGKPKDQAD